jgi:hypothetical protein
MDYPTQIRRIRHARCFRFPLIHTHCLWFFLWAINRNQQDQGHCPVCTLRYHWRTHFLPITTNKCESRLTQFDSGFFPSPKCSKIPFVRKAHGSNKIIAYITHHNDNSIHSVKRKRFESLFRFRVYT